MVTLEERPWIPYAIYYPDEDEVGYDGIHTCYDIKELRPNTPDWIKKAYEEYKNSKEVNR